MSNEWISQLLQDHLPEDTLKEMEPWVKESWAAPSALRRDWLEMKEEIPLRFQLNIDVKV